MPEETIERGQIATVSSKPPVAIIDPQAPSSPEVRMLLNDVADKLKLSFAMAVMGRTGDGGDNIDRLFDALVASRSAVQQDKARLRAQSMLSAPAATRKLFFGRYGAIEPAQYAGADRAQAGLQRIVVDELEVRQAMQAFGENEAIRNEVSPHFFRVGSRKLNVDLGHRGTVAMNPDLVEGAKLKKLGLFINAVQCLEETNEVGADEILMGGTVTDPHGVTQKVDQFMVHDDFDEGEIKRYGGRGRLFHEWQVVRTSDWPHTYAAILAMAEEDGGGFADFLTDLWRQVDDEVKKAVAGAVGGAVGAALGSFFGPLGTAVGAAVGWLLGVLVDWILGFFEDDLVATRTLLVVLGAGTKSYYDWAGLTADPPNQFAMNFNGDGGRYRVWCSLSVYP
ncbi:MAG: hypothetical protein AB1942_22260 [Pseudomonadota bacterium]